MTRRTAIWLLAMAVALVGSSAFCDILTVKHAHGELQLKGLIQTYYAEFEEDEMSDTFELRRVWLCASGSVYEKVDFKFLMKLDHNPALMDAFITLKYIPHVDLSFGQMYKPGTYESLTSTSALPFIYYAIPTSFVRGANQWGHLPANRDIGASATFHFEKDDFTMFLVEGGAYNGTGVNQGDNNDQKEWVARACLQPTKGVKFFGNYARGTHGAKNFGNGHDEYQQYSAGLAIDFQGLDLAGEWIGMKHNNLNQINAFGFTDKSENGYGWYVYMGYKIDTGYDYFHTVEPVVRYEYLDPDTDKHVIGDLGRLITYGLNVFIDQNYAKLQLNYIWNINDNHPGCEVADNIFVAQLQGYF
ncbi:MAG: hypothetical protein JW941_08930 [Candidatus Coatesbacteria bacterium]|nr:hypothetical protein [Candidatus Coatesbacteria bacterium]